MPANLIVQAPGGMNFFKQNIEETLLEELHLGTKELLQTEMLLIIERTPQLTGSLALDTSGDAYESTNTDVLVELYPNDQEQLDEYNRVYAQYVEGGILGASSDKIDNPAQMYMRVTTDDVPYIEQWGYERLDKGLGRISIGSGVLP